MGFYGISWENCGKRRISKPFRWAAERPVPAMFCLNNPVENSVTQVNRESLEGGEFGGHGVEIRRGA